MKVLLRLISISLALFICFSTGAAGQTLYVPEEYSTIQQALSEATEGETILVGPGTYSENIVWPDVDGIVLRSTDGPTSTTIDGGQSGAVISFYSGDSASVSAEIEGFTLKSGSVQYGGGIYADGASLLIRNVQVRNNVASASGGGVYARSASLVLESVTVRGNAASDGKGGGIYLEDSTIEALTLSVEDNNAGGAGGGIYMSQSNGTIEGVTISGNTGSYRGGGGIFIGNDSDPTISEAEITDNTTDRIGGGVFIGAGSDPTFTNVSILRNSTSSPSGGVSPSLTAGGVYINGSSTAPTSPTFNNTSISQNEALFYGGGLVVDQHAVVSMNDVTIAGNTAREGAGVTLLGSGLFFKNGVIRDNKGTGRGGGLWKDTRDSTSFYNTSFINNEAERGGAIFNYGPLYLESSTIEGNFAQLRGGGIRGDATLRDVLVVSNRSGGTGGGMWSYNPTLIDVTVANNYARDNGGGLRLGYYPHLENVQVVQNRADINGGGLFFEGTYERDVTIERLTVSNNSAGGNGDGVYVKDASFAFTASNISHNGGGIFNPDNSSFFEAASNWWGDSSGPYNARQNPVGKGDSTNSYVNVDPWLTQPNTDAPPIPVQGLKLVNSTSTSATLVWSKSPIGDLEGYKIYYDTRNAGHQYENVIDAGRDTSYTLSGLQVGGKYRFAVTVYDIDGNESWYSSSPVDRAAPSPPADLRADGLDSAVQLRWQSNGERDLAGYDLYRSSGSFTDTTAATRVNDARISAIDTTFTDDGVTNGRTYYYRLVAVDEWGNRSEASSAASATPKDTTPPAAPSNLLADGLDKAVQLSWKANSESDLSSYRIYRDTSSPAASLINSTSAGTTSYVDSSLANGTTYYYRITAIDNAGNESDYSKEVEVTPRSTTPPAAPSNLVASVSEGQVQLSWANVEVSDLAHYRIYRGMAPVNELENSVELSPIDSVEAASTSYIDREVDYGRTYHYRVTAVDSAGGESDFSDEARVFLYPQSVEASVRRGFGDASGSGSYRLVALPGAAVLDVADALPGEVDLVWSAYWDNGSTEDYLVKYDGSGTFQFAPGRGFWVVSKQNWVYEQEVPSVNLHGDSAAVIPLHDGWNIISNPLEKGVAWSRVAETHESSLQPIWQFDGSFARADTFRSAAMGEAFYFLNDQGLDSLVVPYPGAAPSKSKKAGPKVSDGAAQYSAFVLAATDPASSTVSSVQIGTAEHAKAGRDEYDVVAPPNPFGGVSLRLHPLKKHVKGDLPERQRTWAADIRSAASEGHSYHLELRSSPGTMVRLTPHHLDAVSDRQVALLDSDRGQAYDLRADAPVEVVMNDSTRVFRVVLGSEAFVQREVDAVIPDEVTVISYPNPLKEQGIIEYTLPEATHVRLVVYDVLGRRVATLEKGKREAGRHRVQLKGDGLASGIYFGRLQAGDEVRTQKITVVR